MRTTTIRQFDQSMLSLLYGAFALWVGVVLIMTNLRFTDLVESTSLSLNTMNQPEITTVTTSAANR